MLNNFCRRPLWEVGAVLSAVAMGRRPADTVIRNARLVNVCTGELQENIDVAIAEGRIALVGDAAHCVGEGTEVIDAAGACLAPGFMDGHIHVESSMMTVRGYAEAVLPHGTTGIYMDPHEIGNVLGLPGVRLMIDEAALTPLKNMVTVPSCVPAVPGFEDTGAAVGPDEIREMMTWPAVVGLGEMMNFPGVLSGSEHTFGELAETLKADKVVTGHFSIPDTGRALNAYIASGVRCCHESTRPEDVLEKIRRGMYALLREGSAWHDLHEIVRAITENHVDTRFVCLISDDTHPHTLCAEGHLDHLVRRAVEEGLDPVTAIQMVTINVATCFRMDHELGSVTPGKCADLVLLDDLKNLRVTRVLIDGVTVAADGRLTVDLPHFRFPDWARSSMHVGRTMTAADFRIPAPEGAGDTVRARAIEIIPARVGNYERIVELPVRNGLVEGDVSRDLCKCFVFERHNATGSFGCGFVTGFGLKRGAMAQTVAHDAHNLLVTGTNDEDMALAANTLIECGGGLCAVCDGKVLGLVPLPIAGLMNDKPAAEMDALIEELSRAWRDIGCEIVSPFMTLALVPLACLPELRLTNRGLVDCRTFRFVDLFVK